MKLSSNLFKLRTQKQYTQQQLANIIGASRVAYTHWESGKVTPPLDSLMLLAKEFGVTLDELCGFAPDISKQVSKFNTARAFLKGMGIKSTVSGEDVELTVYGTGYTVSKNDVPDLVDRAEALHRRMMKDITRTTFAAALVLTVNDEGKNKSLTREYLDKLLSNVETWEVEDDGQLTPAALAGFLKDRLALMSKKDRKNAWEQAVKHIANYKSVLAQAYEEEFDDFSKKAEWEYSAELFK